MQLAKSVAHIWRRGKMENKREHLGSRLGFILLSAGCAVGMGNVWKFPWMTGQYGGATFVIIYIGFLILLGLPIMSVEYAIGRAAQKSPVKMFEELEPKGSKWHRYWVLAYAANWLLMMFYSVVTGWMFYYFLGMILGKFENKDAAEISGVFGEMLSNPKLLIIATLVVVVLGFAILGFGVQKGLEKVNKVMMITLLALIIILAIRAVGLEGGAKGLEFYLKPSIEPFKEKGVWTVINAAMSQAFFTLSLGIGSIAIFGSYIGKDRSLLGESLNVVGLDTLVALIAGLIIFPCCSAFGVDAGSGPSLIFVTLPNIFSNMSGGRVWGSLFFLFMSFAAFSTILAVYENIVACTMELFSINRKKACISCGILMFILSMPCALGFNVLSGFEPFEPGSSILDIEDFLVSNIALPLGSLCYVLFVSFKNHGWGWDNFINEVNQGEGLKFPYKLRKYMLIVIPIIILITFVMGMIDKFSYLWK